MTVYFLGVQLYIEIVVIDGQWLATFLLICQTKVKRHTLWMMTLHYRYRRVAVINRDL